MRKILSGLWMLVLLTGVVAAEPVVVGIPDTIGQVGVDIGIPIVIQDDVTGLDIFSVEGEITYDPALLNLDTVTLGSMSSGWSLVYNASTPGVLSFAMASGTALEGEGNLIVLQFTPTDEGNSNLSFTDFMFNMGTPEAQTSDGSIQILPATCVDVSMPFLNVAVDGDVVVPVQVETDVSGMGIIAAEFEIFYDADVVEVETLTLSGMTAGWSLAYNAATPGVISVAMAGTALEGTGDLVEITFHATGADGSYSDLAFGDFIFNNGLPCVTTTDGRIYVGTPNVLGVSFTGGYITPGAVETICVNLDSVAQVSQNVVAFEFTFDYDPTVLTPIGYEAGDVIPGGSWNVVANLFAGSGRIEVAAAGSEPLDGGPGSLVCFTFQVIGGECDTSDLTFDSFTWNAGLPAVEWTDGMVIASTTPETPLLYEPGDGACISSTTPTFNWEDTAPSGSYHLLVAMDDAFTDTLIVIDEYVTEATYTPGVALEEGTYFWKVKPISACGREGDYSEVWSFQIDTTAPQAVVLMFPVDGYYTNNPSVELFWETGQDVGCGIDYYTVILDEDMNFQTPEQWTTSDTSFVIPLSLEDHVYYWKVKAYDLAANESPWSEVWSFEVDTDVPDAPTLNSPIGGVFLNSSPVTFEWGAVTFPPGKGKAGILSPVEYVLEIDTLIDFAAPVWVDTVTGTSSSVDLVQGSYYWRLKAFDLAGNESGYSVDSFGLDLTPPGTATLISPSDGGMINDATPEFVWNSVVDDFSGTDHYVLELDIYSDFATATEFTTTDTTYTPGFDILDGVYYWRVKTYDVAGNKSPWSEVWSFEVDTDVPDAPTLNSPIGGVFLNSSPVTFEWGAVTFPPRKGKAGILSPVEYVLEIDTLIDFAAPVWVDTVTGTSSSVDLVQGSYYWRLKAFDLAGNESGYSVDSFALDLTAPGVPTLISPPMGGMINDPTPEFIWSAIEDDFSGTDHYLLELDTRADFATAFQYEVSDTSYTLLFSLSDGLYYWRVKTLDVAGNESSWSTMGLFNLDSDVPLPPVPLSPLGGFLGSPIVTFMWSEVTIPTKGKTKGEDANIKSPVHYVLTVTHADWDTVIDLMETSITLTVPVDSFGLADWFVYAYDEAGNQSETSDTIGFGIDLVAPRISNTDSLESTEDTGPFEITTDVYETPDVEAGVSEVLLHFKLGGGDWDYVPMGLVEGTTYSGEIPGPLDDSTYVMYYVEACDAADPAHCSTDPPDTFYTFWAHVTGVRERAAVLPRTYSLSVAPNPARNNLQILLALPEKARVELKVYDVSGKLIRNLDSGIKDAGYHTLTWDGRDNQGVRVSSGIYFLKAKTGTHIFTRKILLTGK